MRMFKPASERSSVFCEFTEKSRDCCDCSGKMSECCPFADDEARGFFRVGVVASSGALPTPASASSSMSRRAASANKRVRSSSAGDSSRALTMHCFRTLFPFTVCVRLTCQSFLRGFQKTPTISLRGSSCLFDMPPCPPVSSGSAAPSREPLAPMLALPEGSSSPASRSEARCQTMRLQRSRLPRSLVTHQRPRAPCLICACFIMAICTFAWLWKGTTFPLMHAPSARNRASQSVHDPSKM
mmetsp:Transcript_172169/g.551863  ORF Transcript_172169/g.551863 Transcript_172169/m.551863 type:complete len:241 (+) Transcript_172169:2807-3529(+)